MTTGSNDANGRTARTLRQFLGLVLLAGAISACLYLLSREGVLGGGRFLRYGLRAGLVVCALVAWFWSQALIGSRSLKDQAIGDGMHDLTAPLTRYLLSHPRAANATLILRSLFIDAFGLFLIAAGIFGSTLRPFVALLIVFAFRQVCQALCALPAPRDMIWRHPGFPSLLVTYGVGMLIGTWISGVVVKGYQLSATDPAAGHDWTSVWLWPASMAVAVLFQSLAVPLLFLSGGLAWRRLPASASSSASCMGWSEPDQHSVYRFGLS